MIWGRETVRRKCAQLAIVCDPCFREVMARAGKPYGHA